MALKKYFVTKDIYHKGKLLKAGSIVASETNHKYFEPYKKEEFSNEKEPATIVLKDDETKGSVEYDENGVVIKPGEKKQKPSKPENSAPKAPAPAAKGKTKAAAAAAEDDEEEGDKDAGDNNEGDDAF